MLAIKENEPAWLWDSTERITEAEGLIRRALHVAGAYDMPDELRDEANEITGTVAAYCGMIEELAERMREFSSRFSDFYESLPDVPGLDLPGPATRTPEYDQAWRGICYLSDCLNVDNDYRGRAQDRPWIASLLDER